MPEFNIKSGILDVNVTRKNKKTVLRKLTIDILHKMGPYIRIENLSNNHVHVFPLEEVVLFLGLDTKMGTVLKEYDENDNIINED